MIGNVFPVVLFDQFQRFTTTPVPEQLGQLRRGQRSRVTLRPEPVTLLLLLLLVVVGDDDDDDDD